MGRKVFVSMLGAGFYEEAVYQLQGCQPSNKTRFIQRATLEAVGAKNWGEDAVALILLTDGARKSNWSENIANRKNHGGQEVPYNGLEKELKDMKFPFPIRELSIPDGKNQEEMWRIFSTLFEALKEGDCIYFDLTHSFRYIPMLVLVLSSYAKFLKKVTIEGITYGNYECKSESGVSPIVDLLPLSALQDWTFAAGQYLKNGVVDDLKELSENQYKPILNATKGQDDEAQKLKAFISYLAELVDEFQTCRGMRLINSNTISKLKIVAGDMDSTFIEPLNPLIDKIKSSLDVFHEQEDLKNALSAATWCYHNRLYQQAATILQEFVVSVFCNRHDIAIDDEEKREVVNQAFTLKSHHQEEEKGDNWKKVKEEDKPKMREIITDDLLSNNDLVNTFRNLTEVRNDYNHSGMRSKTLPLSPSSIKKNIGKCIENISHIFKNYVL